MTASGKKMPVFHRAAGTFDGKPFRKSLKTRSFEWGQQVVRELENGKRELEAQVFTIGSRRRVSPPG
jgi:hypothetical protein